MVKETNQVKNDMSGLLLGPGLREIAIYGDGSFSCDLLVGAWAAYVPSLGLQLAGLSPGSTTEHFELCALVEGVVAVVTIDHTTHPTIAPAHRFRIRHGFPEAPCLSIRPSSAEEF